MEPETLTGDWVIQKGGWSPHYARVRLIVQDNDVAMAFVDGNGDGAEYEIEAWSREEAGWQEHASSGGPGGGIVGSALKVGAIWCVAGIAAPGSIVHIRWQGTSYECRANQHGFWGWVRRVEDLNERPAIIDAKRPSNGSGVS